MLGPDTRISSFSPIRVSLSVTPGSGTPMQPQRALAKCAVVAPGAVSVVPHEAVSGMWSGVTARSLSHSPWGRAAAA